MHYQKLFLFIYCLTIFSGCQRNKTFEAISEIQLSKDFKLFKIENISIKQHVDSIIKEYFYLPLQTAPNCLIGRIDKLFVNKSRIYIIDGQSNCIFVFKKDGSFDYKICRKGAGPGEYDAIMDADLLDSIKQIVVLSKNTRKLIFYNSINGEFIKEIKMNFGAMAIASFGQDKYLFDCKYKRDFEIGDYSLVITDSNFNINKGFFPRINYPSTEKTPFTKYNGQIYYCSNYSYDVFAYLNDTLTKKYSIDFGEKKLNMSNLPIDLFTSKGVLEKKIVPFLDKNKFFKYLISKDIAFHIMSFLESKSFISFNFVYQGKVGNAIINKSNGKVKTYLTLKQDDEFCFGDIKTVFDDYFIGTANADFLFEVMNKLTDVNKKNNIMKKLNLLNSESKFNNPFLIFIRYKNF